MLTNTRLALASYALSAGGTCGFSLVALSYALSAPHDFAPGTVVVCLTNESTTAPLHVEVRSQWTDMASTVRTTPLTVARVSNSLGFGGTSSVQAQTLTLLASGQDATLPFQFWAGSMIQVVVYAASTVADAAGCSGQVALWKSIG